jgi:ATP-dependent DNA helicase RecG
VRELSLQSGHVTHPRLTLDDDVAAVRGVGPGMAARLRETFGIATVGDLLAHLPVQEPGKYRERAAVKPLAEAKVGEAVTVVGDIADWQEIRPRQGHGGKHRRASPRTVHKAAIVDDAGGRITAPFFNQPWVPKRNPAGCRVAVTGRLERYRGELQLGSARLAQVPPGETTVETGGHEQGLVPTYPASADLPAEQLTKMVRAALEAVPAVPDPLPETLLARRGLVDRDTAVRHIHFPPDHEAAHHARQRLVYDELLTLQLGVQQRRTERELEAAGMAHPPVTDGLADALIDVLPFPLTGAQQRAVDQLGADLAVSAPMQRLLQGDVGSGKTIVAAWAMLTAVDHNRQAALMAPTEVLAEQHHRTLTDLLAPLGVNAPGGPRVELITRSLPARALRRVLAEVAAGDVDVLIGTHALLQDRVDPPHLGVVVIDEQHRFGVEHRATLRAKGSRVAAPGNGEAVPPRQPDVLVMTATPIPRSLALTWYGDLDVTTLDELPPGRQGVKTVVIPSHSPRRARLEAFVRQQADAGQRAFVVCPTVDESDVLTVDEGGVERSVASARATYERLAHGPLVDVDVGLAHGRLPAAERESVMDAFRRGEIQVLVATTVIEVGLDVPEASLMVVEDADRFGISQLHQLRGRVGRGAAQSYCALLTVDEANPRLRALAANTDGFALAEVDMELRGEGSLFATRQSGLPDLKIARLVRDADAVAATRDDARALLAADPQLERWPQLRAEVAARYDPERLAALDSG